jgi:hypothetical protein
MKKRNRDLHAKAKTPRQPKASADPLSFQRSPSKAAIAYEPHTAAGETVFKDSRGVVYGVEDSGALRAISKPRSRVKRIRQERAAAALARAKKRKDSHGSEATTDGRGEEAERSSTNAHARRESAD